MDTAPRLVVAFPAAREAFLNSPYGIRTDSSWHKRAASFYATAMEELANAADRIGSAREVAYACHDACDRRDADGVLEITTRRDAKAEAAKMVQCELRHVEVALHSLDEVRAHLQSQLDSAKR